MLSKLLTALALLLVIEGLFPFISPNGWKKAMSQILQLPDERLRTFGLVVMLVGVVLLYFVNR